MDSGPGFVASPAGWSTARDARRSSGKASKQLSFEPSGGQVIRHDHERLPGKNAAILANPFDREPQYVGVVDQTGFPERLQVRSQNALHIPALFTHLEAVERHVVDIESRHAERLDRAVDDVRQTGTGTQRAQVVEPALLKLPKDAVDKERSGPAGEQPEVLRRELGCSQIECQRFQRLNMHVYRRLSRPGHGVQPLMSDAERRGQQPFLIQKPFAAQSGQPLDET